MAKAQKKNKNKVVILSFLGKKEKKKYICKQKREEYEKEDDCNCVNVHDGNGCTGTGLFVRHVVSAACK